MAGTRKSDPRAAADASAVPGGSIDAALLDLLEEGVVVHGPDGAVDCWNAAAGRILGMPASRLVGSLTLFPGHHLALEDGQPLAPGDEPARVALRTGRSGPPCTVRIRRADGTTSWLALSAAPWPARDGDGPAGALTVIRDLTALKSAEQRARGAHRMEAIGRLAGGVAHDFNNLLTAILGYNDLLLRGLGASDPRRQEAEQVRQAAQRAAELTHQLLAFGRRQQLDLRVLDLDRVVQDMRPILSRLAGEAVRLEVRTAAGPARTLADRTQIEQVLLNLAVNARDAMPRGGRLRFATAVVDLDPAFADAHPGSRAGSHLLLSVSDDGCGMDEKTQAHIFEPFFTTKSQDRGTGLGLSIVYGIVKQSGGYIAVESAPDQGATFRIYLPCCDASADEARSHESPPTTRAVGGPR